MNAISIRRAMDCDASTIVSLLRELAVFEKLEGIFRLTEADVRRDMLGGDPAARCEIVFAGDDAIGLAVWYWLYGSFRAWRGLYVEDLYVRPDFRGHGAGRALLAHLARTASDAGAGWMEWRVLDWNARAIAFYRGLGARPLEDWVSYRLDGEAMAKLGAA
jgi:GNAT superfamily N-acetyltransferase